MLPSRNLLRMLFTILSLESILNLAALLIIPYELGDSFLFGYSVTRSAFVLFDLLLSVFLITITVILWLDTVSRSGVTSSSSTWYWYGDFLLD